MQAIMKQMLTLLLVSLILTGCGSSSDSEPQPPTANAGVDQTVDELTLVTLTGSGNSPDGNITTYQWSQTAGTEVSLNGANSASATFTAPDIKPDETLIFQLQVTDNHGNSASDSVNILVRHINQAPTVNAGPNTAVDAGEGVTITATAEDSDGTIEGWLWQQTGGPAVTLNGTDGDTVSFTAPVLATESVIYLTVRVTDDEGAEGTDQVQITVAPTEFTITAVTPSSADIGQLVSLSSSLQLAEDSKVSLRGDVIDATAVVNQELQFEIPSGARSGPLYIVSDGQNSLPIWYTISEEVFVSYDPNALLVANGTQFVGNYLLLRLTAAANNIATAETIADSFGLELLGSISSLRLWQVSVEVDNYDALVALADSLQAHSAVESVVIDSLAETEAIAWDLDPALGFQRDRNAVEQAVDLYFSRTHDDAEDQVIPVFMSMAISEDGIDYSLVDFARYLPESSVDTSTQLYALNREVATDEGSHGSNVTGLIAASLGDGGNAGLISALDGAHGGASIVVSAGSIFERISNSLQLARSGVGVINWSWGVHRADHESGGIIDGALSCHGEFVTNNTLGSEQFYLLNEVIHDFFNILATQHPQVVIVSSAGNGATNAGSPDRLPTSVNHNQFIVVSAHSSGGEYSDGTEEDHAAAFAYPTSCFNEDWELDIVRAHYANYGHRVDISASGSITGYQNATTPSVRGTSYAAPIVSATVALIQSINPNLTPNEIKSLLRRSAMPIFNRVAVNSDDSSEEVFTRPLTSSENSDFSDWGARLNVAGALELAFASYDEDTIGRGTPIGVTVPPGGETTITVDIDIPGEGAVFDRVDIMFVVDVSGSYSNDMVTFRNRAPDIMSAFASTGGNVNIGLASFSDFPISPFGTSSDYPYRLDQALTSDYDDVISALNDLRILNGADVRESQLEALYQTAQPETGWRPGALPIIFLATDANFHNSDTNSNYPGVGYNLTLETLTNRGITVFGLQSGGNVADVLKITSDTGGEAYSLSSNSAEIVEAVLSAVDASSRNLDINLEPYGDFNNMVTRIVPHGVADAAPGDPIRGVNPGDTVSFDVTFTEGALRGSGTHRFSFRLRVTADGIAVIYEIPITVVID